MFNVEQRPGKLWVDVARKIHKTTEDIEDFSRKAIKTPFGYIRLSSHVLPGLSNCMRKIGPLLDRGNKEYPYYETCNLDVSNISGINESLGRHSSTAERSFNWLLPLLEQAGMDPALFAASGNVFSDGSVELLALSETMDGQPGVDLKNVAQNEVVWWRDINGVTYYYKTDKPWGIRKFMNAYGLYEEQVIGHGSLIVTTGNENNYDLGQCYIPGSTVGDFNSGSLMAHHIKKNLRVLFTKMPENWRDIPVKYLTAPVADFGIIRKDTG